MNKEEIIKKKGRWGVTYWTIKGLKGDYQLPNHSFDSYEEANEYLIKTKGNEYDD